MKMKLAATLFTLTLVAIGFAPALAQHISIENGVAVELASPPPLPAPLTPDEIAAAQAQAEAQALVATLPTTFETGVAILEGGHWMELVPLENGEVQAIQISNSPLDPATRAAMKAAAVTSASTNMVEWRSDNRALRSSLATNAVDAQAIRNSLSATSATAQVRSAAIALAREHDNLVADVRELRRLLTKYVREDDQ